MAADTTSAATYELKSQARALCAVEGDADRNRFVLATLNLRAANELHVLEFNEDTNEVTAVEVCAQPHEVWDVAACPSSTSASRVLVVANEGVSVHHAALLSLPCLADADDLLGVGGGGPARPGPKPAPPEEVRLVPPSSTAGLMRRALWNPNGDAAHAVTVQSGGLHQWALDAGTAKPAPTALCSATVAFGLGEAPDAPAAAPAEAVETASWDPHHAHTLACGSVRGAVATVDLRTMKHAAALTHAHRGPVRTISYNPNRPYVLATAGDDRCIKFWDVRKLSGAPPTTSSSAVGSASASASLLALPSAHMHSPSCCAYNRFHDQLLLSGGTDCALKLWRVAAISSSPPSAEPLDGADGAGGDGDPDPDSEADGLVRSLGCHEESVYSVVWSAADAWLFGSLSFDGRFAINYVPAAEKYRILL